MYKKQIEILLNTLMLLDGLMIIISGYLAHYLRWRVGDLVWTMDTKVFLGSVLGLIFINNITMDKLDLYSPQRSQSIKNTLLKIFAAVILDFSIISISYYMLHIQDISRLFILFFAGSCFFLFSLERIGLELYLNIRQQHSTGTWSILLLGSLDRVQEVYNALQKQRTWGHQIIGYLGSIPEETRELQGTALLGSLNDFEKVLKSHTVDEVIFTLPPEQKGFDLQEYLQLCREMGISYRIVPAMYNFNIDWDIQVESIQNIPTINVKMIKIDAAGSLYKRLLDYFLAIIGSFITLLLLPFIALAIKLDSKGPIFFRQTRQGQNGRLFQMLKFRTMYQDAEQKKKELELQNQMQGYMFKLDKDPRVTKVGRFLRKTSLDELPQFFNVLKGEMSLVGTRPPTLDEVTKYLPRHRRRISIKPGITRLWQTTGRNKVTDFEQVVELDLKYIDNWSLWLDIKIILKTILVVLARKGAF